MSKQKTVYIFLQGRAGNQMFQIAFGKYLEQKGFGQLKIGSWGGFNCLEGFVLQLPTDSLESRPRYLRLRYTLFRRYLEKRFPFNKCCNTNWAFEIKHRRQLQMAGFIIDRSSMPPVEFRRSVFRETYVRGWFERANYVKQVDGWVRENFREKYPGNNAKTLLSKIRATENSTCLTFRRGDYLVLSDRYICDETWFKKAVALLNKLVSNPTIFVFSDDPGWCKENLCLPGNVYFEEPNSLSITEKMLCMSSCEHFIISNSTFSWWAQYLGSSPQKTVIAPDKWFRNGSSDYPQRMDNWILLATDT